MYVQNRVALITGGVSGLGLCIAKEFLRNGIRGVTLMDINEEISQEVVASLKNEYGQERTVFIKADVTNASEFEDAFKKTIEIFKNIDIVVNAAGIADEVNSKKTIDINLGGVLTGTFLAMDNYLPKYKTMSDPVIVNISSIFGLDGTQSSIVYTATKHAVTAIGKCLSMKEHFDATGVKLITLCPGVTETPLLSSYRILPGRYDDIAKEMVPKLYAQKPEVVSRSLVKILNICNTGDVWLIEDDKCKQLEIPDRFSLKILKTLDV